MIQLIKNYKMLFVVACSLLFLISCANMGSGPQGGGYDFDAPVLLKATPHQNATNVTENKLHLYFNENVVVKSPNDKVIVTPPQKLIPKVRSANRKVTVELRDSLLANTTYTIDFTDAIVDNNQDNPLENFSLSFSTGDYVDTLTVSGKVIQADNLEPQKGYYVGLHSNLEDTAFTKTPFERISRTNDRGEFTIRGIAPGKYHIFALDDKNRDYTYDNPMEAIAYYEVVLEPTAEAAIKMDTVFFDINKTKPDTIKTIPYTKFLPDNIVLKSFTTTEKRQYLQKTERQGENKVVVYFGAPTEEPKLDLLNFDAGTDWAILERNLPKDSIYTYWIKDKRVMATDTLVFDIYYNKSDSLDNIVTSIDSISVMDRSRKPKVSEKKDKKKEDEKEETVFMAIETKLASSWDRYKTVEIEFSEPTLDSLSSIISLKQKVDTTYKDILFTVLQDTLNPRIYKIHRRWNYGEEFKISIDSASITSIYGLHNDKWEQSFKFKTVDQYAAWAVTVSGIEDSVPAFMELLDKSEKVIKKSKVIDRVALFRDIDPGTYYARLIIDTNGNNEWDTGNYKTKVQPETVYYFPNSYVAKANFEHEEQFIVDTSSTSKPEEILKNKPQDNTARQKLLEKEDAKNQQKEDDARRQREDMENPERAARRSR